MNELSVYTIIKFTTEFDNSVYRKLIYLFLAFLL